MYLKFDTASSACIRDIMEEIDNWAKRYDVRYSYKSIKLHHRVAFDKDKDYTLFQLTWSPADQETRPWLRYQIINVQGELY